MQLSMNRREVLRAGAAVIAAAAPDVFARNEGFFATRGLPLGVQLYMFGDAAANDLLGTLQRAVQIGYRTIELPGIQPAAVAQMRAAVDKCRLKITSVHLSANRAMATGLTVLDEPGKIAEALGALNCKDAVVPFPVLAGLKPKPGQDPLKGLMQAFVDAGPDPWERTASLLNERGRALRDHGITLSYHNHNLEFLPIGDHDGWQILLKETDPDIVSFEIDIGWVVAGGMEPVSFLKALNGRVRQVHVKDLHAIKQVAPLSMESTEVGSGVVDWSKVLPAAYDAGARQFYVEQEPPYAMDRFEAAAKSFAYLSNL